MNKQFALSWVVNPALLIQGWMENPEQYPVWGGHKGYDFQLTFEPVPAFHDGRVMATGKEKSWGDHVWVMANDNTHKTIYAHFSEVRVKKGDQVKAGDILGISGATGSTWRADGSKEPFPHLHFGLQEIVRGVWSWVNPGLYFAAKPGSGGALVPDVTDAKPLKAGKARTLINLALRQTASKDGLIHARIEPDEVIEIFSDTVVADGVTWRDCKFVRSGWIGEREGDTVYLEQVKP